MNTICFLIDDDADDSYFLSTAINEVRPDLLCVTELSSQIALTKLYEAAHQIPEFIFLDLNMPVIDGRELITRIKQIEWLAEVPIIVFSTSSIMKDIDGVKALGAAGYMVKPGGYHDLVKAVALVLSQLPESADFILYKEGPQTMSIYED
ncbi:response regulator [Telluribacter humicola]|uniref:response regulator n=1 Tax=Telluribacter humicola TaxID=1720261 RepID=UPI001A9718EB|nr:response regulator [Telluribacter humicola]